MKVSDPKFAEWVQSILDEVESEFSCNDDSDLDPDYRSSHDSDSELGEEEENENELENEEVLEATSDVEMHNVEHVGAQNYYGKNRFKWRSVPPAVNVRTRAHNLIFHLPGVIGPAKGLGKSCSESSAWSCLVTDDILEEIVKRTNEKLRKIRQNFSDHNKYLTADI